MRKETIAIRQQLSRAGFQEHSAPIYLTSSYAFENAEEMRALFSDEKEGNIYSRYSNPNTTELIEKVALLEGAEAGWATASGMAAVFTTFASFLGQGDHIVSCRSVFGSTHKLFTEILPKWGISHSYVDYQDIEGFAKAIKPNTKMLYLESPSNPGLSIIDLEAVGKICKEAGILYVVDNCFATPIIQQPIQYGADLVIHSATKFMDGQGRALGGLIVGEQDLIDKIQAFARHSGPCMSPFNAWLLSKSLETLSLRMEKHSAQALELAKRLEQRSEVLSLRYPHLPSHPEYNLAKKQMLWGGGIVSFEIAGGLDAGRCFLDSLQLFTLSANLGDTRSIATHPASTTHSKLSPEARQAVGISDGLIRLSIGLEHIEDIWEDILRGLAGS